MNIKQVESNYKLATVVALLSALCLGSAQIGMAFTINFFPVGAYDPNTATMDATLGVTGYTFENFETTTLVPGLSITYAGNVNATQSSLPQVLSYPTAWYWDGLGVAINDPANGTPQSLIGYYAILTTFTYSPGASSMGIGLGGFQSLNPPANAFPITDHRLYINGVVMNQTLESLAGPDWTGSWLGRDGYLRVDAGLGETITSIGFEDIQPNGADDILAFDHLAFDPIAAIPEPSVAAMLSMGMLLLWRRIRDSNK